MKLSNTLMLNATLLPSNKKAFTLAEVLITLSILGVVAALTIPSLVNRQSDLAAQTKLKKAIANYENVMAVYMAENEATNVEGMLGTNCANLTEYFKVVEQDSTNNCKFTTADGVYWELRDSDGFAAVTDAKTAPRYGVSMWVMEGQVNGTQTNPDNSNPTYPTAIAAATKGSAMTPTATTVNGVYAAPTFINNDFKEDAYNCGKVTAAGISSGKGCVVKPS